MAPDEERFGNSELLYSVKHPMNLRSNSHFTKLLGAHGSIFASWNWIHVVKGTCKVLVDQREKKSQKHLNKLRGMQEVSGTMKASMRSDLPDFRKTFVILFLGTGLDYAGLLLVKVNKDCLKTYLLVLFTRATTPAIHLELVSSMSIESFIQAFKRFTARRGIPNMIIHDI